MLSIGLMSGSSMDGIDAALLETDGTAQRLKELAYTSLDHQPEYKILLKAAEFAVRQYAGDLTLAKQNFIKALISFLNNHLALTQNEATTILAELVDYLQCGVATITLDKIIDHSTFLHAEIVLQLLRETGLSADQINVIGYHGQTLYHQPNRGISVIVGDGQKLADRLKINVVSDFRRKDIEAGGQGAPFAPIYHQALAIRDQKIPVAVVNCGGIANVSLIFNENDIIGFDTGPGNALIDSLVRQHTHGKQNMDKNGQLARQGQVNQLVLNSLYEKSVRKDEKNYFTLVPPKSLDYGDIELIAELKSLSIHDACATLAAFTADSIVTSVLSLNEEIPRHWILAGGGWKNLSILSELKLRLQQKVNSDIIIETADQAGWNSQALESQLFAYLAVRSINGLPLSFPKTTGVLYPATGGTLFTSKILEKI